MIYARLKIAPSLENVENASLRPNTEQALPVRGRLSVLDESIKQQVFDTVRLTLRGVIASCVGQRSVLEDIITLTDIKTIDDFRPGDFSDRNDTSQGRHSDFFFQIPMNMTGPNGDRRAVPLTCNISGSTSVSNHTAVNDRQIIQGNVEISYWIEAQFRLAGQQVGYLHETFKLAHLHPRLRGVLPDGLPVTIRAKRDILARCKFQKAPELSVSLYEPDLKLERIPPSRKCRIAIPLAVTMDVEASASVDARQSLKCVAEVKWEVQTRFSTAGMRLPTKRPTSGEVVYKSSMAATQKTNILFRPLPLYDSQPKSTGKPTTQKAYAATAQLELDVPDSVMQPSVLWEYYSRTYSLNMSLNFSGIQGAPKYTARNSIPLMISTTKQTTEIDKDGVIVDVIEAVSEELDEEQLGALRLSPVSPQVEPRQRQAATRTPPPAYFR